MRQQILWMALVLANFSVYSQNILDKQAIYAFANYLEQTNQYAFAIEEYERYLHLDSANLATKLKIINLYTHTQQYTTALEKINAGLNVYNLPDTLQFVSPFYAKLLLKNNQYSQAQQYITSSKTINYPDKINIGFQIYLLQNNYAEVKNQMQSPDSVYLSDNLKLLGFQYLNQKHKKPWLAAGYSLLIPGLGKVYTSDWKDGLISLLFVSGNTWQAYRGFKKYGTQSAYGWIFGSIAVGFYTGNIFGSFKAAKLYNKRIYNTMHEKISNNNNLTLY